MTTLLDLRDPTYVPIEMRGVLFVQPYFLTEQVKTKAQDAIKTLLSFDQVEFADTLYLSKVYEKIEAIEGVEAVTITRFNRQSDAALIADTGKIELGWDEIPVAADLNGIVFDSVIGGAA